MFSKLRIQTKITVLLVAVLAIAVVANIAWSSYTQLQQAEKEMLEKTQILNIEMQAVWEFIDINQRRIDTDASGEYNFKNIYCAIAGKSVAALFMRDTDYVIRYVSLTPRKYNSQPDEFEQAALEYFQTEGEGAEVYEVTTHNGRNVFRYTSPIFIEESCLDCHGKPAGELDITNYPKEGLSVGDIAGAVSIIMPIDLYMQGINQNILQQSLYFALAFSLLIVITHLALSRLVRRLEHANVLLKQESSYKSDFLATMSHELRTPLTSIIAFAEILGRPDKKRTGEDKSHKDEKAIDEIKENGQVLLEMVDNILAAAHIDAGETEPQYEWVDMVDLISTVEGVIRPLAEKKQQTFSTTVDREVPLLFADWEKLRRIVENLASNAVKYTKPEGMVRIEVSHEQGTAQGEEVVVRVIDNGIGIKDEDKERLFAKFVQIDHSAQRRYRGSGLGLMIVKELSEAHGGSVEFTSEYKQGSTFTVRIPVLKVEKTKKEQA